MKKIITFALLLVLVLSLSACKNDSGNNDGNSSTTSETDSMSLSEMDTGATIHFDGTAITRGSDDDNDPSLSNTVMEDFAVNFAGNTSVDNKLSLDSTYQYFYIKVVNTGDSTISVTIGNDSSTQSANYYQIPNGTYYIWSTKQWPTSNQNVSFSCNSGMYGNVYAYLCSTSAEAEAHI